MKFIADAMLGRLAKRMRLLGFDVLYDPELDDNGVIRVSLEQDRVILTRDTGLIARPLASNHFYLASELTDEQTEQVIRTFNLAQSPLTRCTRCNTLLTRIDKQAARDLVPVHVFESKDTFFQCGNCGRTYWRGTHVSRMESAGIIKKPGP